MPERREILGLDGKPLRLDQYGIPVAPRLEHPFGDDMTPEKWAEQHTGVCDRCSAPARLYPAGWLCTEHEPGASA